MSAKVARVVRDCLQTLNAPLADGELLRRFQRNRDADAFAELVARHGPVVLGVCRRALGRSPDVDDAFQATFLALARRPGSVRDPARLPGWLHRVALRTANRVLKRRLPTRSIDEASSVPSSPEPCDVSWSEGLSVLDEELTRLPDRLRTPLVLCYLEGLTRDEAAERLGWSLAFVKRRLEEGRRRLRDRLVRRGVSAALLAAATGLSDGLRANVPPNLLARTSELPFTAVPDAIRRLVPGTGVLMGLTARLVLGVGLTAGVATAFGFRSPAPQDPPPRDPPKAAEATTDFPRPHEAPLPPGAITRLGSTRFRHPDPFNCSALSPDGKLFATMGELSVVVWNMATGERIHAFRDPAIQNGMSEHTRMAFSPDGKYLAYIAQSQEAKGPARVCDLKTGKYVILDWATRGAPGAPGRGYFHFLAFGPNGKELFLFADHGYRVFDPRTGNEIRKIDWTFKPLTVTPDAKCCLVRVEEGNRTFLVLDLTTGKETAQLELETAATELGHAALTPDGKRAAVIADSKAAHVWDVGARKPIATLDLPATNGRDEGFTSLAFARDGKELLVGCQGGAIRRYDLETKKELPALERHLWWVTGVHATADGKTLVSSGWDGAVRRFDLDKGREIPLPDGYAHGLVLATSPDGKRFAVGSGNGRLDLYDRSGKLDRTLLSDGEPHERVRFSPDGKTLAVATDGGRVRFWNTADWREGRPLEYSRAAGSRRVHAMTFSPDSKRLLAIADVGGIQCWYLNTRARIWQQSTEQEHVAAYSPDGRNLLTGEYQGRLTWRDPTTGNTIRTLDVAKDPETVARTGSDSNPSVDSIDFAPDGRTFVTAHHDALVRHWDTESGKLLGMLKGHTNTLWWARISPDGKWVASGSVDRTIRVWELATSQMVLTLEGHDGWVWDGLWGRDGRTLLTTAGAEALLWSVRPADLKPAAFAPALWDDLLAEPTKAYRAQWALLDDAKAAARLFRERQAPEKSPADEKQVRRWVADLDSDTFRVREHATKALSKCGRSVIAQLRDGQKVAGPEGLKRLTELLADLEKGPTANEVRHLRAVQVLELAGSPEAIALLKEWAGGHAGFVLTDESAAALKRLSARPQ